MVFNDVIISVSSEDYHRNDPPKHIQARRDCHRSRERANRSPLITVIYARDRFNFHSHTQTSLALARTDGNYTPYFVFDFDALDYVTEVRVFFFSGIRNSNSLNGIDTNSLVIFQIGLPYKQVLDLQTS